VDRLLERALLQSRRVKALTACNSITGTRGKAHILNSSSHSKAACTSHWKMLVLEINESTVYITRSSCEKRLHRQLFQPAAESGDKQGLPQCVL